MNYQAKLCQLIFGTILLLSFFLGACSSRSKNKDVDQEVFIKQKEPLAKWFISPEEMITLNDQGLTKFHPFFDLKNPETLPEDLMMKYFVVTPEKSSDLYQFDLVSGSRFQKHRFCPHRDIWNKSSSKIDRPNFSVGILAGVLGTDKRPQEIWVFGKPKESTSIEQEARIVGGLILENCQGFPCRSKKDWKSKVVLLGVSPENKAFDKVEDIESLKKKVNWKYFKAFAQSGFGSTRQGNSYYPSYRITSFVEAKKSLEHVYKFGHHFSVAELETMKEGCSKLYQKFYDQVYEARNEGKKFSENLYRFFHKFKSPIKTCRRYIPWASINREKQKFWFYSYLMPIFQLDELGHTYSCRRRAWMRKDENSLLKDDETWKGCYLKDIREALRSAVLYMKALSNSYRPHYRFIEYDSGVGGSREKVFSWVFDNGKALSCGKMEQRVESYFPSDITWEILKLPNVEEEKPEFEVIR